MIFYRVPKTTRYALKDELFTETEVNRDLGFIDVDSLIKEEISKNDTITVLNKRFKAKRIVGSYD